MDWLIRLLLLLSIAGLHTVYCDTNGQDAGALLSLMNEWQNTPPSWGKSNDPCDTWEGVRCSNSRVTSLKLSTMGLKGTLNGDIGQLTALQSLDLSYNPNITGPLTPTIGNLKQLTILILMGCSFSGNIPKELGNIPKLYYIALNSNKFTGSIPASLGSLSQLYWLDLADNQLSGTLPVSTGSSPGLDMLINTKHFHFNKNQLSGSIPEQLFNSSMTLIHVLFDNNRFTGNIPESLGSVQTLEVLRLDKNVLTGSVPSLKNLTSVNELNLANNQLSGPLPDLSGMSALNYVDLSNNIFAPSLVPKWMSQLQTLTVLAIEAGGIEGQLPTQLFSFPQLQQVLLKDNNLSGSLNLGNNISPPLQLIDLQNNNITGVSLGSAYLNTLILVGNPACSSRIVNDNYCRLQQQPTKAYSTSLASCGSRSCPTDQSLSPQCNCAYPYQGQLVFRAPFFRDLTNSTTFQSLETKLWQKLSIAPGTVSLQSPYFDNDNYLEVQLQLFPTSGQYFNRSEIQRIGFDLSNQTFNPPHIFGPYFFIASPYPFPGVGIYAFQQKKRAERAMELSKPFASWAPSGNDTDGAPQLKGARWFSYDDLKKSTNNFSNYNEIGSGGYGKVYRGILPTGQIVAIKRAQQGSMQGGREFKTEIELLSRVHHKNLVGLVGFCFEQGEQMLVYEFVPNGTLRDSLKGKFCVEESAADRPTMSELVKEIETILQNDGINTNTTSASSSATDFGITKGAPRHPYNDPLPKKDISSNAFEYSGGISFSAKVEPK
ncbi:putative leucine-rich repeat receptor-like protein kinase [Acorus gramineus]|uniref:non-specific serine/threonine protein kinase n=1 Tax=Acorus gramineus TaxID=55184 RepID=A0AAV9AM54_ACOGR|nr:putative leucine-rich repeat receptor-like protein kinase [Acorus gramineus]